MAVLFEQTAGVPACKMAALSSSHDLALVCLEMALVCLEIETTLLCHSAFGLLLQLSKI